jgi:hypothetical protein
MTNEFSEEYKNEVIISGLSAFIAGLIACLEVIFSNPICLAAF